MLFNTNFIYEGVYIYEFSKEFYGVAQLPPISVKEPGIKMAKGIQFAITIVQAVVHPILIAHLI